MYSNAPMNYLVVGSTQNWQTAFNYNPPLWGFTERQIAAWRALNTGDIIYFYAAGEAKGIIGKGRIKEKIKGYEPIWHEENVSGVKWPLRFYIEPLVVLRPDLWKAGNGPLPAMEFGINGVSLQGKQILVLKPEQLNKIENILKTWDAANLIVSDRISVDQIVSSGIGSLRQESNNTVEVNNPAISNHLQLINAIEDMGRLQNFFVQKEFTILNENRRIDVIWRRELYGAPTYAFEVELSGGIDKAINKLYRCNQLWNTVPRIVAEESERDKVHRISASLGFEKEVVMITPSQIQDIYNKKKSYKELERRVGIL